MRKILFMTGVLAAVVPSLAAYAGYVVDVDKATAGSVSFVAVGRPSMLRIKGSGSKPTGKITVADGRAQGQLTFDLDSLDTGMGMRNRHMKEKYLEVPKYPKATLTLSGIIVPKDLEGDATIEKLQFQGVLNVHGKDAPVSGEAKIVRKGASLDVDAQFSTKTTAHDIPTPRFAGITVGEDVSVDVVFTAPIEPRVEPAQ